MCLIPIAQLQTIVLFILGNFAEVNDEEEQISWVSRLQLFLFLSLFYSGVTLSFRVLEEINIRNHKVASDSST
jgi:hypothetical protein